MKNIKDLYNKLEKDYKLKWIDNQKESFNIYFTKNNLEYMIYVDIEYLGYFRKTKGLFRHWKNISHDHFDDKEDIEELYKTIISFIEE